MKIEFKNKSMESKILFDQHQIDKRIVELAKQVNADYASVDNLVVLVVLNGSLLFAADLVRHLQISTEIETIRLSSYDGMKSTGQVQVLGALPTQLTEKHVLVVEDIVESGKTLEFLLDYLHKMNVASVKVCSLLNKPQLHKCQVSVDYIGFDIGDHFVIGYGLDLDGKYRNLPYVAELIPAV